MDSLFEIIESKRTEDICKSLQRKYLTFEELKESISDKFEICKEAVLKNISNGKIKINSKGMYLTFSIEDYSWFEEIIQKRIINKIHEHTFPENIFVPNSIMANLIYEGTKNVSYDIKYAKRQIDIQLLSEIKFKDDDLMFYSCLCSFWKKSEEILGNIENVKIKFSDIYKFINVDITSTFNAKTQDGNESCIPIEFKDFLQRMIDLNEMIKSSSSIGIDAIKCCSYETTKDSKRILKKKYIMQSVLSFSLDEDGIILLQKPQIMSMSEFISNQFIVLDRKKVFNWKNSSILQSAKFEIMRRIETSKNCKNRMNPSFTKKWWQDHFEKINYNSSKLVFFFKRLEKDKIISNLEFPNKSETFVKWTPVKDERNFSRDNIARASLKERKTEDPERNTSSNERAEIQSSLSRDDFQNGISEE